MKNATFSLTLRRTVALMSLCTFVAAATAIWLGAGSAQAAPGMGPSVASGPRLLAEGSRGMDVGAPSGNAKAAKAKGTKKARRGKTLRGKLNLNTASEEQLRMLPGVGPAKARRILESRNQEGKFRRVRDLRRVKGFGAKTLKKLAPYLTIEGATTLSVE